MHCHLLKQIVAEFGDHLDLNQKDKEGTNPIALAFRSNSSEMVKLLLKSGKIDMD